MSTVLFENIKTACHVTDRTIVMLSGGKDSVVALDLCVKFFNRVDIVFMYLVDGLSFCEAVLKYYEDRYGIGIIRIPHFMTSSFMKYGVLRNKDIDVPIISPKDVYNYVREITGTYWISGGERTSDSIIRNAMIKSKGTIDYGRGRFYPVGHWNKSEIMAYVKRHKLKVSPESSILGYSLRSLMPRDMAMIKNHYPDDYEIIRQWYPLVEASVKRYEFNKIPEL